METFFASSGITAITITVILVQLLSLVITGVGLLCYRSLINSRREFLLSLHVENSKTKKAHLSFLLWLYVPLSLIITVVTIILYLWFPYFLSL